MVETGKVNGLQCRKGVIGAKDIDGIRQCLEPWYEKKVSPYT